MIFHFCVSHHLFNSYIIHLNIIYTILFTYNEYTYIIKTYISKIRECGFCLYWNFWEFDKVKLQEIPWLMCGRQSVSDFCFVMSWYMLETTLFTLKCIRETKLTNLKIQKVTSVFTLYVFLFLCVFDCYCSIVTDFIV